MRRKIFITVAFIFVSVTDSLLADIIVTKDGMILNGKIIEDKKPDYLIFANNYGEFTIEYEKIDEIHETESFESDIRIFKEMGVPVNENEIKTNFRVGEEKLKQHEREALIFPEADGRFLVTADLFYLRHFGKLKEVLHNSSGAALSVEIPVNNVKLLKMFYISGIYSEVSCIYSEEDERSVKGGIAYAGPLWRLPVVLSGYSFDLHLAAAAGAGWFSIKGVSGDESAVKSGLMLSAGPAFGIYSVVLLPGVRFNYIYDGFAPMISAGVSLGAGYRF